MAAVRFLLLQGTVLTWLLLILHMPSSSSLQAKRSNGRCIASERDVLLSLKASLSDPGGQFLSWKGEDCCQWKGVHCSNRTNHVVKLDLHGDCGHSYGLGGEMSSSLVGLQHLNYLDLSCNDFSGASIPKFIGSLNSLEYLDLSFAEFGGRMPPQLGNLSKLVYLDLNSLNYRGSLYSDSLAWVPHLSLLKYLDMSWTNLNAAVDWIHGISSLRSLEVLYQRDSNLTNTITIVSHSNLTALKELDISGNSFHTAISPSWFWHVRTLTSLDLSSCGFQGPIPYEMGNITSLEQVYIYGNNIVCMIPPNWENLCNLKIMDLSSSNITGDIGDLMDRLPKCSWNKLYQLDFSYNKLDGSLPNWLQPLKNLSYLNLHSNDITGPLPLWIGGLNNLTTLYLGSNRLVGEINEEHFKALTNLQVLDMSDNSLFLGVHSSWIPSFKLKVAS